MNLQAIFFDFDGVLADTERLHLQAYQEVLAEQGVPLSAQDYYARYLGLDDYRVFLAVAHDCGLPTGDARLRALVDRKARRYAHLIATTPLLFDGVDPLVREWARHLPLAVASGALREEIEDVLGGAGLLGCFAAIVSATDVARGKPAPDPYLTALSRLQSACILRDCEPQPSPTHCVAIEDSLPGIASAKTAGMRTVAIATNHPAALLAAADLVVPSVTSLDLAALDRLVATGRLLSH